MATSVRRPCLLPLAATLILLCFPPATAQPQRTYDPLWSDEYWAKEIVVGEAAEEVVSVAARRAEAGGYSYGCARLWLAMGCPPAPGKGVNGSLVDGRRSYDRELDRFEDGLRQCIHDVIPDDPYLRRTAPTSTFDRRCCPCCYSCARYY
nr:uncharacterized protein LOC127336388 [Lolium perenne]